MPPFHQIIAEPGQHAAGEGFAAAIQPFVAGAQHPGVFVIPVPLILLAVIDGDVGGEQKGIAETGDFQAD